MTATHATAVRVCRLGRGGIVQIRCVGPGAAGRLHGLLARRDGAPLPPPAEGRIDYARLRGPSGDVDEVLVAWTADGAELNCHGGTAAARAAHALLRDAGFDEATPEEAHLAGAAVPYDDLIAREAALRWPDAATERQAWVLAQASQLARDVAGMIDRLERGSAVDAVRTDLRRRAADGTAARRILRRWTVALVGAPNAGKSTLFNALAARERALAAPTPGTTRDAVRLRIDLSGFDVELIDTAGLLDRAQGVDAAAVARARDVARAADLRLLLVDGSRPAGEEDAAAAALCGGRPTLRLRTKADLPPAAETDAADDALRLSARDGRDVAALRQRIAGALGSLPPDAAPPAGNETGPSTTGCDLRDAAPFTRRQVRRMAEALAALERGDAVEAAGRLARCLGRHPDRDDDCAALAAEWAEEKRNRS